MSEETAENPQSSSKTARRRGGNSAALSDETLRAAVEFWSLPPMDLALLRQALLHTSALAAHSLDSNERLEFLGDSIVNAVVAEAFFREYPQWTEGDLAKGRALVVSKLALYEVGLRLGLSDLIVVGSNTDGALARGRRSLVADAVEALIAAVYLQFGWERARAFVLQILSEELAGVRERRDLRDAKTILQERFQSLHQAPPQYRIIAETGDPHSRIFTAEVLIHGNLTATGTGRSKKDAEQSAAAAILASPIPSG